MLLKTSFAWMELRKHVMKLILISLSIKPGKSTRFAASRAVQLTFFSLHLILLCSDCWRVFCEFSMFFDWICCHVSSHLSLLFQAPFSAFLVSRVLTFPLWYHPAVVSRWLDWWPTWDSRENILNSSAMECKDFLWNFTIIICDAKKIWILLRLFELSRWNCTSLSFHDVSVECEELGTLSVCSINLNGSVIRWNGLLRSLNNFHCSEFRVVINSESHTILSYLETIELKNRKHFNSIECRIEAFSSWWRDRASTRTRRVACRIS